MASFCKDCSIKIFGKDFGDFAHGKMGLYGRDLCEGCGEYIYTDWAGRRVTEESVRVYWNSITIIDVGDYEDYRRSIEY